MDQENQQRSHQCRCYGSIAAIQDFENAVGYDRRLIIRHPQVAVREGSRRLTQIKSPGGASVHNAQTMRSVFAFLVFPALLLVAADANAAPDGAQLYARHCAACHGNEGAGGVGVPLALPDFQAQVDDSYLRSTIRLGRPGRVMPAFEQMSDAEVSAIVRHVRSWRKQSPVAPVRVRPGNTARGAKLYTTHCATCHGANGEGGHGTGVTFSRPRDLPILAPSLANSGFLASASDAFIKTTLVHGRGGTPMPAFPKQGLRDRDLDDIVAFVRTLESKPSRAPHSVTEPVSLVRESPYDVATTVDKLKTALNAAGLRIIRAVPFDQGLVATGREDTTRFVVDACDFKFLNKALAVDPRVGLFLPCRITVIESKGKVLVMSVNPKRLSALFNNVELDELCEQMHRIYTDVIEEATL
jgi:cytochrome c oxidase cbb3-type subunit 3